MTRLAFALFLFSLAPQLSLASEASAVTVIGTVFEDRNANLKHDAGEPGIAGVKVSDGVRIVVTDRRGAYRIDTSAGRHTFVIKPPAYRFLRASGTGLPSLWTREAAADSASQGSSSGDFPLVKARKTSADFDALVFTDSQPKTLADVAYYQRDIVDPIRGRRAAAFGVTLGDIVSDDLSLFSPVASINARLDAPWFYVPGNHDLDFDAGDDAGSLKTFAKNFGPDTFALEEGRMAFIGLDDVVYQPEQAPKYIGGLREEQFVFLRNYLSGLGKDSLVVIGVHIPLFDTAPDKQTFRHADRERLFALLQPFPNVLILSGHTHNQQHVFHTADTGWRGARPLHEYNVGAACGAFWSGVKDAEGIPAAGMSDGTPNGYALLSVHGSNYALRWFNARAPESAQIGLHAPKVLRRGAYPAFGVYANFYMGDAQSHVEYRIDGSPWKPMQRVLQPDPALLAENIADDSAAALRGYDRSPEASISTHLWRGTLPTDLAAGEHRIEVRAFDRWRGEVNANASYRLDEAIP